MSSFTKLLRGLLLSLPIIAASGVAILGVSAQTAPAGTPAGQISTQKMSDFESYPNGSMVGTKSVPPVAMIVASTDEQLFYKAYTDYTDMSNTGSPDITYNNSFVYQGYFNPDVCYAYSGGVFVPSAAASNHACSGAYSGNFMNWTTMSRLDILRYAMYGGLRTTDTATKTVLTRAIIPNDGHAWVKVYTGSDVSSYVKGVTGTSVSLCNATIGNLASATNTSSGLHLASGIYTQWASMEASQCGYGSDANQPTSAKGTDLVVSVQVCDGTYDTRSMCKLYGATSIKPTGVLQQFGQSDSAQQIRFALMSGSRATPRSGGVLRKNAAFIEGNLTSAGVVDHTCATASNEVNFSDGTFCKDSANKGVIQNLSLISLNTTNNNWDGGKWQGCNNYGIYNRYPGFGVNGILDDPGSSSSATQYHCGAWGNPVAEMYGEALRYMSGATSATTGFASGSDGLSMTSPSWQPPVTNANWCASCAIVLISSGQVTFDGDEIPALGSILNNSALYNDINAATDAIGTKEGINGNSYIVGRMLGTANDLKPGATVNTTSDVCQAQTVSKFSLVRGVCPDGASMEGSYLVAGQAWQAWVNGITLAGVDTVHQIKPVRTYAVALSESMPTFNIPTSAGTVTLAPLCQSSNAASSTAAPLETGADNSYRTCGLLALQLGQITSQVSPNNIYGKAFDSSGKTGSFTVIWDDSTWGNDHDLDVTSLVSWCVGSSCGTPSDASNASNICWNANLKTTSPNALAYSPATTVATANNAVCSGGKLKATPGPNQVLVRTEVLTAVAGNNLSLGFSIAGTSAGNGIHRTFYRSGVTNANLITGTSTYPAAWTPPQVEAFTAGGSAAGNLQNPLWYAAKYGGFIYEATGPSRPATARDALPTQTGQWQGSDGNPSNYFLARNPSALIAGLQNAFQQIADSGSSADNFGNATTPSSSNDIAGNGLSYQVQYFRQRLGVNWTGGLQAFWSDSDGYQREGTPSGGNQVLASDANYVVSGRDTNAGALPGTLTSYRCSIAPVATGSTPFDPSTSGACSIVSATNPLVPAWDAGTLLNAYYDPSATASSTDAVAIANLPLQRAYSADASATGNVGQRYIFTYLTDKPNGGTTSAGALTTGTQTDFVWNAAWKNPATCPKTTVTLSSTSGFWGCWDAANSVRTGNYGLLNEKDPALAQKLVNWVRGMEDPADYRARTNNLVTGKSTYRLGDIVDSSPMIVGTPAEAYDLLYNDYTYAAFRSNYSSRRQMVYVGANDGMLHAFNAGFYLPGQAANGTTPATNPMALRQLATATGLTSGDPGKPAGNNWALGQEAWAFVPGNLLPHLRWLADKNYTHVFYVDGSPAVSDVQVWGVGGSTGCQAGKPAASDIDAQGHVCGWGTVMVVPFHLGGGLIAVDTVGSGVATDTQTSNSAYVIMDVTDPEQPPTVLGEITTGSFTLGAPAFAVHKESDGTRHYLLTIGSGPADNGGPSGTTNKPVSARTGNLGVWVYDLANVVAQDGTPAATFTGTSGGGPANSFTGDMVATDFNLDYSAEGVYFGVVTNPPTTIPASTPGTQAYGGALWKLDMNTGTGTNPPDTSDPGSWTLTRVIDTGRPVTIRPTVATDASGRRMIYFGTGRAYTPDDLSGANVQGTQQQAIYGVSDNSLLTGLATGCPAMPSTGSLFNAASSVVSTDGTVSGSGIPTVSTLASLQAALVATNPATGCYQYSGWMLPLAAGNAASNVQQPSERVISSQTLFNSILLTPTYIPPSAAQIAATGSSDCNPIPVPGTSYLYGLNYLTGTADTTLQGSFGVIGTTVSRSVSLGSGVASSPVLHVGGGKVRAAFGIGGGTKLQNIGVLAEASNGEISWREPVDNQ